MRKLVLLACFLPLLAGAGDFSGTWTLKSERPELGSLPEPPPAAMTIEQNGSSVLCEAGEAHWSFSTDGKESRAGDRSKSLNTVAKYEGAALLINTIVNGARGGYTQMDRWQVSRDGTVLTIHREIVRRSGNAETTLVYEKPGRRPPALEREEEYTVEAGTRIPLVLLNSVSTRQSSEGDRVYLQTGFPIVAQGRIVIPPGSYVTGTLTFVKRPGRVMGRGELYLRFDSVTLPNGVTRDFRSRVGALDGQAGGHLDRREGNIKSEGNRSGDARNVAETTAAGASVGAIAGAAAGRPGLGTGIGAAAGAAAGLMGVLLTRGPDTVLGRGSTLEMVLDRTLIFTATEIGAGPGAPTR
jgi:type IV secretion system protein VirB10